MLTFADMLLDDFIMAEDTYFQSPFSSISMENQNLNQYTGSEYAPMLPSSNKRQEAACYSSLRYFIFIVHVSFRLVLEIIDVSWLILS